MAHITISSTATRITYTASGGQTAFTIPFEFFDEDDLDVYKQGTLLTKTTHYTVTPVTTYDGGFDGGTVTLTSGNEASADDKVTIELNMAATRTTDFPTSGVFNITTLNTFLDKTMVLFKQLISNIGRKVGRPATSTETYSLNWPDGATTTPGCVVVSSDAGIEVSSVNPSDLNTSVTAAATSATASATSATASATSATAAATSATTAASEVGAVAYKYTWSNSTSMADPGTGSLRYNHGTTASVTAIAIDDTTADTGNPDINAFIATWDDSTSTIKGQLQIVKVGTPATFAIYNITGLTDNSGWAQIAVAHVSSSGTLSNSDSIRLSFTRTGLKGETGSTGSTGSTGPQGPSGDMSDLVDDTSPQLGGDLDANGHQVQWSKGADVASNSALAVGTDGNYFDVTGTTTITSINTTGGTGTLIKLHFDGACQLTHHASNLILAGGENFTTEAGDELEFVEYGSGTYRQTGWCLAGTKPGGGGGGAFLGEGASGASVGNSGDIIRVNENTLNTSQTMAATDNGSATGPLSIASGVTLTISSGATFVVI